MAQLLSQRKYAAHRGVSLRAVQKAIESGRITPVIDPVTKKPKIDPAIADAQWVRNTDPELQLRGTGELPPAAPAGGPDFGGADDADDDRRELLQHRTAAAKADAQLKTMSALERAGELVIAEDVEREDEEIAREVRNAMLSIPDRVAQVLDPANPERARKLLDAEIRKALRGLETKLAQRAAAATEREETLQ